MLAIAFLLASPRSSSASGQGGAEADGSTSFPDPGEIFQGRTFRSEFDREVFFLRKVRDDYPAYWPSLLSANIRVNQYVLAPNKLLRFIEELRLATAGTDDPVAITNLAAIVSDPDYYANTNAYRPRILRAAAETLIQTGAGGRQALAASFSERHYRTDPVSLEALADVVGQSAFSDPGLRTALAATAFSFTATNGGYYPRCTREATRNLLRLPGGTLTVEVHLHTREVLANPGRFQDVVAAIAAAHAVRLGKRLDKVESAVAARLKALSSTPGAYRDDLSGLQVRLKRTIEELRERERTNHYEHASAGS